MKRILVAAAMLMFLPWTAPAGAAESVATPERPAMAYQDPLRAAPVHQWAPVLFATGSLRQAAIAAGAGFATSAGVEAFALGDADGDDLADVLLTQVPEEGPTEIRAYSPAAGRDLWSATAEDGYWYPVGDVNADGVVDVVFVEALGELSDSSSSALPVGVLDISLEGSFATRLLDGASGQLIVERDGTFGLIWQIYLLPVVDYSVMAWTYGGLGVVGTQDLGSPPSDSSPTIFWDRFTQREETAGAIMVSTWIEVNRRTTAYEIEMISAEGQSRWKSSFDEDGTWEWVSNSRDVTGDGVADFVLGTWETDTELWVWPVTLATPPRSQELGSSRVKAIDGATGRELWLHEGEPIRGRGIAIWGGFDGKRAEVLLIEQGTDRDDASLRYATRVTRLDAASGQVRQLVTLPDERFSARSFVDVDGDGRQEFLLSTRAVTGDPVLGYQEEPVFHVSVADRDFKPLWEAEIPNPFANLGPNIFIDIIGYFGMFPIRDFDGDGVPELSDFSTPALAPKSGANGTVLWTLDDGPGDLRLYLVADATGDGGSDLVILRTDAPDAAPEPSEEDGQRTSTPAGDSSNARNEADYPMSVTMLRGSDLATVWSRPFHDPAVMPGHSAKRFSFHAEWSPDAGGDGRPDILLSLTSYYADGFECGLNGCREVADPDRHLPLLHLAMLADSGTGAVAWSTPEQGNKVAKRPAVAGPAGIATDGDAALGVPWTLGLLALAASGLLLRRRN